MKTDSATLDPEQIVSEIERIFRGVSRGEGITLHEAEVIDACGDDRARDRARKFDNERKWQDVPAEQISKHWSVLSFLDEPGFRYYLPAYMRWAVRNYRTSDSPSSDFTIYALQTGRHDFEKMFTEEELRVIARFLRYMRDCTEGDADDSAASEAWSSFWCLFDD